MSYTVVTREQMQEYVEEVIERVRVRLGGDLDPQVETDLREVGQTAEWLGYYAWVKAAQGIPAHGCIVGTVMHRKFEAESDVFGDTGVLDLLERGAPNAAYMEAMHIAYGAAGTVYATRGWSFAPIHVVA